MGQLSGRVVYLVDDDASLRRSIRNLLSSAGFRVETFPSAEAFLAYGQRENGACLVLDLRLTGMSGAELLAHLRATRPALPVIMLTAHGDDGARTRSLAGGAVAFLTKPFRVPELLAAVRAATQHGEPARPRAHAEELPTQATRMIGRSETLRAVTAALAEHRLVTLLGAGGIGKTTVAVAVAEQLIDGYEHRARFADLSMLADGRHVTAALAAAIGISVDSENPLAVLTQFLAGKQMLLLLDCCERIASDVAKLAEEILAAAPRVRILATSREPLRAPHEHTHRLAPLDCPPASPALTAAEALQFPSVELFIERAINSVDAFQLSDADAPFVATLCRQLCGIPLAIELSASQMGNLGLRGLVTRLDDHLRPNLGSSAARHQTLRATLDWSHELLTAHEQIVFRRLAVFVGSFSRDSALAVASEGSTSSAVEEVVLELTAKSLLTADVNANGVVSYHLLDMTRAYAAEKLEASGELARVTRRHAERYRDLLELAEGERAVLSRAGWLSKYGRMIDDVRAALDWAFSEQGDLRVACALTATSAPVAAQLSYHTEFRRYAARALDAIPSLSPPDPHLEMRLNLAFSDTGGDELRQVAALNRALEIAEQLGSADQALMLEIAWAVAFRRADYPQSLALAERHGVVVASSPLDSVALNHDRIMAITLTYAGEHRRSRQLAEGILSRLETSAPEKVIHKFLVEPGVSMRAFLARTRWFEGLPEQAVALARDGVEQAVASGNAMSLGYALCFASCPIALWTGNIPEARRLIELTREHCEKHSLAYWQAWTRGYSLALALAQGLPFEPPTGLNSKQLDAISTHGAELVTAETLARVEQGLVPWAAAEVLRVKALRLAQREEDDDADDADNVFQQSLSIARAQHALAWELRTSTDLAQRWQARGRREEARALLLAVLERYTEGFSTKDFRAAERLLGEL